MRKIFLLVLGTILLTLPIKAQNRISYNSQNIFLSGMNLAWIDFANDLTNFNEGTFELAMSQISVAGGNSVRWWLHVNGAHSPTFTNNMVSDITQTELESLEQALDIARDYNIGLVLCLWSFDMLRSSYGETITSRNKLMLENEAYLNAYINEALIPLLDYVYDHPAIISWEVFNEPEGMSNEFGWSDIQHVSMANIQRFVNRVAGTIHRRVPGAKVSNGCWSFYAGTDIGSYRNYYSDEELIDAGGDEDGTLDFYMVHYYDWGGTEISPFHHPVSYWELDKPLVIGEFSANGPYEDIDSEEAYRYLYDNGYAGALSWTWTNHDGHGGVEDAEPGMMYLYTNYPDDIILPVEEYFTDPYNAESQLVIYPSPVKNYCILQFANQQTVSEVSVYTINDLKVKDFHFSTIPVTQIELNLQSLHSGVYIITVNTGNSLITAKLIKE